MITATITTRGRATRLYDDTAIAADVFSDGVRVGGVLLRVTDISGGLVSIWGDSIDAWACSELQSWLFARTGSRTGWAGEQWHYHRSKSPIADIVRAVRAEVLDDALADPASEIMHKIVAPCI